MTVKGKTSKGLCSPLYKYFSKPFETNLPNNCFLTYLCTLFKDILYKITLVQKTYDDSKILIIFVLLL